MKVSPLSPPPPPRQRADVDPQIREAAEGLEAMFLNTMMQAMRGTVEPSELSLENSATKIYRSMLDAEVAQQTARTNSVGLADQIIAYLEQRSYNGGKAPVHGRTKPVADPAAQAANPASAPVTKPAQTNVQDRSIASSTGGTDAS